MARFRVTGPGILAQGRRVEGCDLLVANGHVVGLVQAGARTPGYETVTCPGLAAPGFVDVHIHGFAGVSFADADAGADAIDTARTRLHEVGVAAFVASLPSLPPDQIVARARNLALSVGRREAGKATIAGIHLEGPYLSPGHRGAHPVDLLRRPDAAELAGWLDAAGGTVRQVTLAPEIEGQAEVARLLVGRGVVAAIGHTSADMATAQAAAAEGYGHVTHLWNGMSGIAHRAPGAVAAALAHPALTAEVICDGVHIEPAIVALTHRLLGSDRMCVVTDAIAAAGHTDGDYVLSGRTIHVRDGVARTEEGNLAGSTLTMARAVENLVAWGVVAVDEAVEMATATPARALGLSGWGRIAPEAPATLIALDDRGRLLDWPERTVLEG